MTQERRKRRRNPQILRSRHTHLVNDFRGVRTIAVPCEVWLVEVKRHEVLVVLHEPVHGRLHALSEGHRLVVGQVN